MKTYDLVFKLLKEQPDLRNSDRKLLWAVWEWQGIAGETISKQSFLDTTTSAESITRARRKVQELHKDLDAVQAVKKMRNIKQKQKGTYVFREETQTYYFQREE